MKNLDHPKALPGWWMNKRVHPTRGVEEKTRQFQRERHSCGREPMIVKITLVPYLSPPFFLITSFWGHLFKEQAIFWWTGFWLAGAIFRSGEWQAPKTWPPCLIRYVQRMTIKHWTRDVGKLTCVWWLCNFGPGTREVYYPFTYLVLRPEWWISLHIWMTDLYCCADDEYSINCHQMCLQYQSWYEKATY